MKSVYDVETAWHCIFCGNSLFTYIEEDLDKSKFTKCKECDISFLAHRPGNEKKRHGDSFSLTYYK